MSDPTEDHRSKIRALLAKRDPALLAFCDLAREAFGAKLTGLKVQTDLGVYAAGELGPKRDAPQQPLDGDRKLPRQ